MDESRTRAANKVVRDSYPQESNNFTGSDYIFSGLSDSTALIRILEYRGVRVSKEIFEGGDISGINLEWMLQTIRGQRVEARCVHIQLKDLNYLQLPTLILTVKNEWLIIHKRTLRGWQVEGATGRQRFSASVLKTNFSGTALEIGEMLPSGGDVWTRVFKLLPKLQNYLSVAIGASIVVQGLALIAPWLTARIIDSVIITNTSSLLPLLCLGIILTSIFRAWVGWLRDISINSFSVRIGAILEKTLFEHLVHLPFKYLQNKTLGEMKQSFNGIKQIRVLLFDRGLVAFFNILTSIICLAYMINLIPVLSLSFVLGSTLISIVIVIIGYYQNIEMILQVRASQKQHSVLAELLRGISTLKASGCQSWALVRWREKLAIELKHGLKRDRIGLWGDALKELLIQGGPIFVLAWGGSKVLDGEISLGKLFAFSMLSANFVDGITSFSQTILSIAQTKPQLQETQEILTTTRYYPANSGDNGLCDIDVILKDVWFRYTEEGPWIIKGVSLSVQAGTFHRIKGASGCGKSTLLKLLAGLYIPEKGSIFIGGKSSGLGQKSVAFLPQFPQLASGSILDNLEIFSGSIHRTQLFEVADETGLADWVMTLPMGYQTLVSSGGGNLSGGQRQLIAITGIIASSKKLLLLDEALSNLDWMSRQRILHSKYLEGRTIIYGSHEEVFSLEVARVSNLEDPARRALPLGEGGLREVSDF